MPILNCKCKVCGKLFHLKESKILATGNCCSTECMYKDRDRADRISKSQLGEKGYWFGTGVGRTPNTTCIECGKPYYAKPGQISKYCSNECKNRSKIYLDLMRELNTGPNNPQFGKVLSPNTRELMSIQKRGDKNNNWKGGATPLHFKLRSSPEMKQWKLEVFKQDNSTCAFCGEKNTRKLQAHHWTHFNRLIKYHNIKTVEEALKCAPLWDTNNGITLCKICHDVTHDKRTYRREKQWINTFDLKYQSFR